MKKIVFILVAAFAVGPLCAQVIVNSDGTHSVVHGNVIVNSDGSHTIIQDNVIVNSNGTHSTIHGNVIVNSDGSHTIIQDNVIVNSDGKHWTRHGNVIVNPDGSHTIIHDNVIVNSGEAHPRWYDRLAYFLGFRNDKTVVDDGDESLANDNETNYKKALRLAKRQARRSNHRAELLD
jgi:surface antigen